MFQDRTLNPVTRPKGRAAYNDRYPRDKVIGGLLLGTAIFMAGFLAGYDFKPTNGTTPAVEPAPDSTPAPVPVPVPKAPVTPAPSTTPLQATASVPAPFPVVAPAKTVTPAPSPAKTVTTLAPLPVPTPEKEIQSILENVQQRASAPITSDAKMPTAPACQQPSQYQPAHRGFFGRRW